jgi:hypothetical protein
VCQGCVYLWYEWKQLPGNTKMMRSVYLCRTCMPNCSTCDEPASYPCRLCEEPVCLFHAMSVIDPDCRFENPIYTYICLSCDRRGKERAHAKAYAEANAADARRQARDSFPQRFLAAMRSAGFPGMESFYSRRPTLFDQVTLRGWSFKTVWTNDLGTVHTSWHAFMADGELHSIAPSGHRRA